MTCAIKYASTLPTVSQFLPAVA